MQKSEFTSINAFFLLYADLSRQVKDHDKEQMDRVMPVVEKALSQSTTALTDFITLKDAVSSW